MEIVIKSEELKKYKLYVATPMFGGMCNGLYMKSCLDLQNLCTQFGIEVRFAFIFNESLITRARNYLCDEFLYRAPEFTHLLFIDSDVAFNAKDVVALLALDKDIIGAPYPKKSINWKNVKKAVLKNPNIEPGELSGLIGDYVFNPVKNTVKFSVSEPLDVLEIGTGFMLIKREVFEKFKEYYPDIKYKPDHVGQEHFDGSRYIHAFFDCSIDRGPGTNNTERYLSEDYNMCQKWRYKGGQIFLCPWMKLDHCGSYIFKGDMPAIAQQLGEI